MSMSISYRKLPQTQPGREALIYTPRDFHYGKMWRLFSAPAMFHLQM